MSPYVCCPNATPSLETTGHFKCQACSKPGVRRPRPRRCWDHVTPYATSGVESVYLFNIYFYLAAPGLSCQRRQWHPTPVLLPGKSHGGGAWWAAVHGIAMSQTRLSDFTFTFHFHTLEKEMATHSSVLAWRIPGTGKPGGQPSMGLHRVGHD